MAIFTGKTIILGAPTQYGFSDLIERELKHQGFQVYNISFIQHGFKYKNIGERLNSYIHKNFLGEKDYKTYLKFKRVEGEIRDRLADIPRVDYALLIRPDQYSEDIINMVGLKADKTIGYQWDGLSRFPAVYRRINLFDRFFVFDPEDVKYPNTRPITNFYSNSFDVDQSKEHESDAYYVGTYIKKRASQLEEMITTLQGCGLSVKYHICKFRKGKPKFKQLDTTSVNMDYHENLRFAFNSKILLDVPTVLHKGLSFRAFEALGFDKKLITTNKEIEKYDFYHPNNVFIWGRESMQRFEEFLNAPFTPIPAHVKEKYSFARWINHLLVERQYAPVLLPNTELEPAFTF